MTQKKGIIVFSLVLVLLFLTGCSLDDTSDFDFGDIWQKILNLGNLSFIKDGENISTGAMVGFLRITIFILIFALFYEAASSFVFPNSRNIAIVVSLVLSIISAVLIPPSLLIGIASSYATIVSFVLIAVPVVAGLYGFFRIPTTNAGWITIRIIILIILLMVLFIMKKYALTLVTGV